MPSAEHVNTAETKLSKIAAIKDKPVSTTGWEAVTNGRNLQSCFDYDLGATDLGGDGCSWYDNNSQYCGDYDDSDFYANGLCCSCGGGLSDFCEDTARGATDIGGDGCDWYNDNDEYCGSFDTSSFFSQYMCCGCGGGSSLNDSVIDTSGCNDDTNGYTDSGGDSCSWYDTNTSSCGSYDTSNFNADSMCCSCGGGDYGGSTYVPPPEPVGSGGTCADSNMGMADIGGDTCTWYNTHSASCGDYDDFDFRAQEMCCGCGGGCTNTDFGVTDSGGDDCSWYTTNVNACGTYDDFDFTAADLCCACRNVASAPVNTGSCEHTSNGAEDRRDDPCSYYDTREDKCGRYDDSDFTASEHCCGCGGGCINSDATDSGGDSCSWYASNNNSQYCGLYDSATFHAASMCCSCSGTSSEPAPCTELSFGMTDIGGDGCGWYTSNPSSCGDYDSDDFVAQAMCCGCGGGSDWDGSITNSQVASCTGTDYGKTDSGGDGCEWYNNNVAFCGSFDDGDFRANEMCCACSGGSDWDGVVDAIYAVCADSTGGYGDTSGDGCDWYEINTGYCGVFDTVNFIASRMCCTCGGGSDWVDTGDYSYSVCEDTAYGATDMAGDTCDWYSDAAFSQCGDYDDSDFSASSQCCVCGGGSSSTYEIDPNTTYEYDYDYSSVSSEETKTELSDAEAGLGFFILFVIFCLPGCCVLTICCISCYCCCKKKAQQVNTAAAQIQQIQQQIPQQMYAQPAPPAYAPMQPTPVQ